MSSLDDQTPSGDGSHRVDEDAVRARQEATARNRAASHTQTQTYTEKQSVGEMISKVSQNLTALVRGEVDLMKAEATTKVAKMGKGAGLLGGAAVIGLYAFGILLLAAVWGLANLVPLWLAALIVGVVLVIIAAVLALMGKSSLDKGKEVAVTPPDVKSDMNAVKEGLSSGR